MAAVYSSDLQRASATARAIAQACGAPLVLEPGLRERNLGRFQGWTFAEVQRHFPEEVTTSIYLVLAIKNGFYGEVLTNVYFVIMQPIGLYVWLMVDCKRQEETHQVEDSPTNVKSRRMGLVDWIIAIAQTIIIWLTMGLIYKWIGANRSFRDSVTDGTNMVGQKLMTELYAEQWLFWIATNLFSIYLWWGTEGSIDIVVMYLLFTVNSIVGMYRWIQQAKANQ